jgi:hypothetical protein
MARQCNAAGNLNSVLHYGKHGRKHKTRRTLDLMVRKEDSNRLPKLLIVLVAFGGLVVMYPQLYPLPQVATLRSTS